ncbi:hypothetical protein ABEW34_17060 [Paenibacillus algorifonticola]|uniref:hypothetical protein n=1 Tax=Paenibacillus algorifonticola TaxID=684063 RepID=UPI003D27F7AC
MTLTFGDIYHVLKEMQQGVSDMDVDLDRVFQDEGKGILSDELTAMRQSYLNLYNADISLTLNLNSVRKQVDVCMKNMDVF